MADRESQLCTCSNKHVSAFNLIAYKGTPGTFNASRSLLLTAAESIARYTRNATTGPKVQGVYTYLKMADLLSALPIELLSIIGCAITSSDVAALLLVNKPLNDRLTPTLYASVDIADHNIAQDCIRTLSTAPSALAFGRDLAALVRSFSMWYYVWFSKQPGKAKLARRLSRAVGRMTGLQHFTLSATDMCSPNVCVALVRAAGPTLRSLHIKPDDEYRWADGSDAGVLRDTRAAFPELTSIWLELAERIPWLEFFQPILTSRAGHLRKLRVALSAAPMLASPLLCSAPAWPHLQELELGVPDAPLATLPSTPNVRKLTLHWSVPAYALPQLVLPPGAFPALESLRCPYELLPVFLPAHARRQRPIRTVRLNDAYFDEAGVGNGAFSLAECPNWAAVLEALRCLSRSAGPVTDLSFYVSCFDAGLFGEGLAPCAATLERLLVVLGEDPDRVSLLRCCS